LAVISKFLVATDRFDAVWDFAGSKRETDGINASALSFATLDNLLGSALTTGATGRGVVEPIIGKA
jgi:hypothetical protein